MFQRRIPELTAKKIAEVRAETDPQKALEGIVDLFENYVSIEELVPVRFDELTGEPTKHEWKPAKSYSSAKQVIYLGGINLINPKPTEPGLDAKVVELIKAGPIVVNTKSGSYAFAYHEHDASGREQGGGTFCATKYLISVNKVKML